MSANADSSLASGSPVRIAGVVEPGLQLQRREAWLALALACLWMYLVVPSPEYLVASPETGHQLAGAWNLLHYGQQPHLDYATAYGPGRYWVSALGLLLSNGGLLGELLTRSAAYAAYLALLLNLLRKLNVDRKVAWFIFALAAIALPPSYKYWTALCPMLTLWAMHRCCFAPSRIAHVLLGASIGMAALFRPDYGVFALAAVLALQLQRSAGAQRLRDSVSILLGAVAMLAPWLAWLSTRIDVATLFAEWLEVGASQGAGMSLPHPAWYWADPSLSLAFFIMLVVPVAGLCLIWRQPHPQAARQRFAFATCVFGLANLIQSSHRADWAHLQQGMTPGLVAIGLICTWPASQVGKRRWRAGIPALLGLCLVIVHSTMPNSPVTAWQHWSAASLDKAAFAQRFVKGSVLGGVVDVARHCTPVDAPAFFYPFTPQLHYFAERPFAARLPYLAPGFFPKPAQQQRAIAQLELERPGTLFWDEHDAYDNRAERLSTYTHADLFRYVTEHYARARIAGTYTIFQRRDAMPVSPACAAVLTGGDRLSSR